MLRRKGQSRPSAGSEVSCSYASLTVEQRAVPMGCPSAAWGQTSRSQERSITLCCTMTSGSRRTCASTAMPS